MSHLFFAGLKGPHNVRSRQRTRVLASPRRLLVPSRLQSNSQKLLPMSHVEDAPIPPKIRQKCFKSGVIGDSGDGSRRSGGPSPDSQGGRPSTRQPLHPRGGPSSNQLRYHDNFKRYLVTYVCFSAQMSSRTGLCPTSPWRLITRGVDGWDPIRWPDRSLPGHAWLLPGHP